MYTGHEVLNISSDTSPSAEANASRGNHNNQNPDSSGMPRGFPAVHHERAPPQVPDRPPADEHQGYQRATERAASGSLALIYGDC